LTDHTKSGSPTCKKTQQKYLERHKNSKMFYLKEREKEKKVNKTERQRQRWK
jgi:hypothetical protein